MKERLEFVKCQDHEVPMLIDVPDSGNQFPAILLIHGFMSVRAMITTCYKELAKVSLLQE